jgi:dihydrofolate synthase / folylpolyglutamate synthase
MSLDRSYRETIDYLFGLQKHGIKLALSNSFRLMELMGDPQKKYPTVHVTGTNGKGSTAVFIAGMLMAAGYRVGLYTSPHLVSFTERIRVGGTPIPEARVVELAGRVREGYGGRPGADGSGEVNPTFFEVTTAVAFSYFAEEGVDIAVVEVGLGGRLDSTNVITPLVSVITNIDIEHTEFLGNTLEQIAGEKAGIIKPGVPVVTGAIQPEATGVIEREAAAQGSPVFRLAREFRPENVLAGREQVFDYRGMKAVYPGLRVRMLGRHQVDNASLALAAVECLRDSGVAVDEAAMRRGIERAQWEGRMERVAQDPDIYLDGAHNPASAKKLAETVRELLPSYRKLTLVIGVLADKDVSGIVREIVPLADRVVVTRPQYARALDVQMLAAEVGKLHGAVSATGTVGEAIQRAREGASRGDLILVTGSLYVVGDARAILVAPAGQAGELTGLKG